MAVLSKKEQAKIIRKITVLLKVKDLKDIFEDLSKNYHGEGKLSIDFETAKKLPDFLKRQVKNYVSRQFYKIYLEIEQTGNVKGALEKTDLFEEYVKRTLIVGVETGTLEKITDILADMLEKENKFLGQVATVLITPTLSLFISWIFLGVMSYMYIPSVLKTGLAPEKLPTIPKILYYAFTVNKINFVLGIVLSVAFIVFLFKNDNWKRQVLSGFKLFERYKFFAWLMILQRTGWKLEQSLQFMIPLFEGKWKEALMLIRREIESGKDLVESFNFLLKKKLLDRSDFSFLEAILRTAKFEYISYQLSMLLTDIEEANERSKTKVNLITLFLVMSLIATLYLGIFIPMFSTIKQAIR